MSKAGKRGKSAAGQGGPAKWEAALLAAQFEEVNPKILLFDATLQLVNYTFGFCFPFWMSILWS